MNIDYVVPPYSEFAAHMLAQPQPYGLEGVSSIPVAPETLHASLAVYDQKLRNLNNVRERMLSGLEEQVEQLGEVTDQMASLASQRVLLVRNNALSIVEEDEASLSREFTEVVMAPMVRRWRPWYRVPFHHIGRALQKRREDRRRLQKIVVPEYADKILARELKRQEYYRVQDLFDDANRRRLKKLLKDPYYRRYYDGDVVYE